MTDMHPLISPATDKTAFLFPGIGLSYAQTILEIREFPAFYKNCSKVGIHDTRSMALNDMMAHERQAGDDIEIQKLAYITNCTISDIYKENGISPQITLGYSMGMLPALYSADFYSLETGIRILEKAFDLFRQFCTASPEEFGVGLILGFKQEELYNLILRKFENDIEIVIYNGQCSFVVSGEKDKLEYCLSMAIKKGAISARRIPTRHPYHYSGAKSISQELSAFIHGLPLNEPVCAVLSPVDGSLITKENFAEKVAISYSSPLHFDRAVDILGREYDVTRYYESGPVGSIKRMIKHINKYLHISTCTKIIACVNSRLSSQAF